MAQCSPVSFIFSKIRGGGIFSRHIGGKQQIFLHIVIYFSFKISYFLVTFMSTLISYLLPVILLTIIYCKIFSEVGLCSTKLRLKMAPVSSRKHHNKQCRTQHKSKVVFFLRRRRSNTDTSKYNRNRI